MSNINLFNKAKSILAEKNCDILDNVSFEDFEIYSSHIVVAGKYYLQTSEPVFCVISDPRDNMFFNGLRGLLGTIYYTAIEMGHLSKLPEHMLNLLWYYIYIYYKKNDGNAFNILCQVVEYAAQNGDNVTKVRINEAVDNAVSALSETTYVYYMTELFNMIVPYLDKIILNIRAGLLNEIKNFEGSGFILEELRKWYDNNTYGNGFIIQLRDLSMFSFKIRNYK